MTVTTVKDFYTAMERREFVQVLRVRLASRYAIKENPTLVNDGQILTILETFTNLNTLVLLYDCNMRIHRRTPVDMTTAAVSRKVVSLLTSGRLKTLAVSIHSGIYGTKDNPRTVAPTTLHTELLGKGLSLSSQQTIHMALHLTAMPEHSLDQKITYRTGKNALMKTVRPFSPSPNLVSMHLYKCRDIRAQHLPELVLRFPKLQYLYVASVGGSRSEVQTPRRSPGWSERHDAFWRQRAPLKVIHLEGVLDWQICAMGTIAAFVVTMTCISRHELNNAFLKDSEIFPCMKELRCEPTYDIPIRYKEYPWTLKEVMEQRQQLVESSIKLDGQSMKVDFILADPYI
ncbi:hypothetical protein FRC17_010653 [Serendipita sp. 399]|nr:hypothetical protein FRC17_010653 [Serendipita sp. 399]